MLNIFHNFIPNKNIVLITKTLQLIKTLIEKKNHLFKSYTANGILVVGHARFQKSGRKLINIVKSSKENFYNNFAKKLSDPSTSNKMYWSIMKAFINGKTNPYYPTNNLGH